MATPVNDTYTVASATTLYAGKTAPASGPTPPPPTPAPASGGSYVRNIQPTPVRASAPPSWVPPSGFFADVPMLNNASDLDTQTLYGNGAASGAFDIWGASAVLRDISPLGAQVYYSGGHESSSGQANVQITLTCDFSSLLWSFHNQPVTPNSSGSFGSNGQAPDGTQYNPHTYLGLQEFPAAWGGGPKGQLISINWSGSAFRNRVNVIDVQAAQGGYSFFIVNNPGNTIDATHMHFYSADSQYTGSYIVSYQDDVRQGWWIDTNGTHDWMYLQKPDGTLTKYPCLNGNSQDGCLVACGSLNLLLFFDGGYQSSGTSYRSVNVRNLTTGAITGFQTAGTVPYLSTGYNGVPNDYHAPAKMGLQWVEELGAIFGLDTSVNPPQVVKCTPPATGDKATTSWTWSIVPLAHWDAGNAGGQAQIQLPINSSWSKFRWVPSLQAFVHGASAYKKPQVFKI